MPRTCTVCAHDEAHAINVVLVQREPYRTIADHYGVSKTSLIRHAQEHLPTLLVQSTRAVEQAKADDLMGELDEVKADVARLKDKAEEEGDLRTALQGCDKALKALELQARVSQIIKDQPQVNVLVNHPEWVELRTTLLYTLDAYPEARGSVLRALEGGGNGQA
jgi:hypothetical protein